VTRELGDDGVLLDVPGGYRTAHELAWRVAGAREVVPAAATVGVIGGERGELEELEAAALAGRLPAPAPGHVSVEGVTHEIPVVLDGEDLPELARLGLGAKAVARLLGAAELEVAFLGFMPGFAYLAGLPPELARLARRPVPRTAVPAGSLAVAGGYAGIYPTMSPGGWNLLGRTAFRAFDPDRPPYAALGPGDRVRFVPVEHVPPLGPARRAPLDGEHLEVVDPGPQLLVEDAGRQGAGHLGVPRAGAMNPCWLAVANLAVGNAPDAPGLELAGAVRLQARRSLLFALAGDAELKVAGSLMPRGIVAAAGAGQMIEVGPVRRAARAVLAVAGGVRADRRFGSAAADAVSGVPPGPLRAGDVLDLGTAPAHSRRSFEPPAPSGHPGGAVRLRAVAGPDLDPAAAASSLAGLFEVDLRSDRTGVRLRRPASARERSPRRDNAHGGGEVPSHAVVPGCVQLPPGGDPVVLGPDCGPVGGYVVAATVVSADLWRLGTLEPGQLVSFELVSLEQAAAARLELARVVAASVQGWYPTATA
jgi:KipI family sensor histidine kinase inhibitor